MQNNATRIGWIDTAKGLSALLVVLWHAFLIAQLTGRFPETLAVLNHWLVHVRMPLFFLAAGVVSARLIQASLAQLLQRRILPLLWILVIWTVIDHWVNDWFPLHPWTGRTLPGLGSLLWEPSGELWFIYDLLVLTLLAKVAVFAQGWRRGALLLASYAMVSAYDHWRAEYFTYELVCNFPFFMIGVFGAEMLRQARVTPTRMLLVDVIGLGGALAAHAQLMPGQLRGTAESLFCVGLVVAVLIAIQAAPRISGMLDAVGRRSLAIFLGHVPVLAAVYAATPASTSALHPIIFWLGLFGVAVAGSLLLERMATWLGLQWLYRFPVSFFPRSQPVTSP